MSCCCCCCCCCSLWLWNLQDPPCPLPAPALSCPALPSAPHRPPPAPPPPFLTQAFFYGGKSWSDADFFVETEKSNGENAKLAVARVPPHGDIFLVAGSKNTCLIWPADEASTDHYAAACPEGKVDGSSLPEIHSIPGPFVAKVRMMLEEEGERRKE